MRGLWSRGGLSLLVGLGTSLACGPGRLTVSGAPDAQVDGSRPTSSNAADAQVDGDGIPHGHDASLDAASQAGRDAAAPTVDGSPEASMPQPGDDAAAPWPECSQPSIDRLTTWLASGEGLTVPATGDLLVAAGDHYSAHIELVGAEWHVFVVYLGNKFDAQVDLTVSKGFTLTYRATDDFYVQLRPASAWDGGDKYLTPIPSTAGALVTRFFTFDPGAWTTLQELGTPSYSFESALSEARGLVFVGNTPNAIAIDGLRVDGLMPSCD